MPATIEIHTGLTGVSLTASLYPAGSDLAAATDVSLTESTNRKGCFTFTNSSFTGLHSFVISNGSTPQWTAWAVLGTSGTIVASETRAEALLAAGIDPTGKILHVGTTSQLTTNLDKTGYQLAEGALSASQLHSTAIAALAEAVWQQAQRTLTSFDFSVSTSVNEEQVETLLRDAVATALAESVWTAQDVQQTRYQLGLDGTAVAPATAVSHLATSLTSAALAQLAGLARIEVAVPTLLRQELSQPLVRGDNYTAALQSAIEFSRSDFPKIPEGSTCRLNARLVDSTETFSFSIYGDEASIPVTTGSPVVRFEPTSSQTSEWLPGRYEFDVTVELPDGESRSFIGPKVFLRVLDKV